MMFHAVLGGETVSKNAENINSIAVNAYEIRPRKFAAYHRTVKNVAICWNIPESPMPQGTEWGQSAGNPASSSDYAVGSSETTRDATE